MANRWMAALLAGAVWVTGCSGVVGGTRKDAAVPSDGADGIDAAVIDGALTDGTLPEGGLFDGAGPDAAPPFTCNQVPTSSPVLDGIVALDPADPHPGDTVTVIVRSQVLDRHEAPPMVLEETSQAGVRTWNTNHMAGGRALYYYAVPNVELGDHCLLGKISGADEISARFTVTPRPAPPPRCNGGIFKVTVNHLWTCNEQPEWGNEIWIYTYDENGSPMPNVTIRIAWPDTTLRPIYNDTDPPNPSNIPETVQTDGSGLYHGYNYWPTNQNGYMVFNLHVDGCASDVATEITTGWWETDNYGCRFCNLSNRNSWGHWSHTVEFHLDTSATQACVIPSDHAGHESGCAQEHIHHDPNYTACYNVP
jgi:hypothetical protein